MNNITIGQYVPGDSWLYKMDPRMKIILTLVLMVLIFLIPTLYGMLAAFGIFLVILLSTRVPLLKILKGLKPIMFLLIFTFVLQIIYSKEGKLLATVTFQIGLYQTLGIVALVVFYFFTRKFVKLGFFYFLFIVILAFVLQHFLVLDQFVWSDYSLKVYESGLLNSSFVLLRIVLMIGITSLLTISTSSMDINNGFSAVLSPLKLVKFPVGVVSMTLSLSLRFIPTLLEETNKIMKAQASRGVDFSEGRLKDKIMQIVSLLIPMFVISIKRADELANAMESRGYIVDGKRTKLDKLKLKLVDYLSLVLVLAFIGGVIWYNVWLG